MCLYCVCGDLIFKYSPPWNPVPPNPYVPAPVLPGPHIPWVIEQVKEYLELLKEIKALEDSIGCPCEPNKADYISMFEARIESLKKNLHI